MKKSPLRISAVSYINAKPFVYGIEHSGFLKDYKLSLDIPSVCAEKLLKGKVDIGLAPVAIIPKLKKHFIFPDFCIGADGPVGSVMLYSDVPLNEIKSIYLDNQSRTSVMLVRILAKYFWKIRPLFIDAKKGYEKKIKNTKAGVIIGDRNFLIKKKYNHVYDLSEQWKHFTGLPFVFACWISNKKISKKDSSALRKALQFGIENMHVVIDRFKNANDKRVIRKYLNHSINYHFDVKKKHAMELFLKLEKKL